MLNCACRIPSSLYIIRGITVRIVDGLFSALQKFSWILIPFILILGWTSPFFMLITLVCMIGPVVFSFFYGRAWCGNFCPRGSLCGALLSVVSPKIKIPGFFKAIWFRLFIFAAIILLFVYSLSQPHESLTCLGRVFIKMMAITTIVQISLALLIHPYAWCSFCPMGTAAYIISRIKKGSSPNIRFNDLCTGCKACTKICPANIDIPGWSTKGEVLDADCMKCRKCIDHCPKHCLEFR